MQPQTQPQYSNDSGDMSYIKSFGINPSLYTHIVIKQVLTAPHTAFSTGNIEAGINSYTVAVNQLESVLRADGTLKDYEDETKKELAKLTDKVDIANLKLKALLKIAFDSRTMDFNGKL